MLELFGIKEKKEVKEETYVQVKPLSIFDYITDICVIKKGNIHVTRDPNLSKFDPFMVMRFLSLDKGNIVFTGIFNYFSSSLTKEELYKSLVIIIPRGKKFLKYPKLVKSILKEEDIDLLKNYFKCSSYDAREYMNMGLIKEDDIEAIKEKYGGREK